MISYKSFLDMDIGQVSLKVWWKIGEAGGKRSGEAQAFVFVARIGSREAAHVPQHTPVSFVQYNFIFVEKMSLREAKANS